MNNKHNSDTKIFDKSEFNKSEVIADKKGMHFTEDAIDRLRECFSIAINEPDFGNGRYVRNVIERARMAQSSRLLTKEIDNITREDILTFTAEDIELPKKKANNIVRMGFCG